MKNYNNYKLDAIIAGTERTTHRSYCDNRIASHRGQADTRHDTRFATLDAKATTDVQKKQQLSNSKLL